MQARKAVPQLESIEDEGFRATAELADARLMLHLSGQADPRSNSRIEGFLQAADAQSVAAGVKEVVVDFRRLEFMNSSCLKSLVSWLRRVQERPAEQRYTIRFLHEPESHWQIRSFSALAAFARGILTIE